MSTVLPHISHRRVHTPPLWLVALTGEHDVSTTPDVERLLMEAVASGDPVVVDLQHATFVDSSILCAILRAEQKAGRRELAVVLPDGGEVPRLFELVDATSMLVTFGTLRHAVEWCYPTSPNP